MLKQRIITALILLPLMFYMLFYSGSTLWAIFAALISLLGLWEFTRLVAIRDSGWYLSSVAMLFLFAFLGDWTLPKLAWCLVLIFWLCVMPCWLYYKWSVKEQWAKLLGVMLFVPFWFALVSLRLSPDVVHAVQEWPHEHSQLVYANVTLLLVMMMVWIADSVAYFVGRAFGKHKLAPVISPKKSWEGVAGGYLGVIIFTLLVQRYFMGYSWYALLLLASVLTFVGIGGDLLESWLKRVANVKDSSQLLPGHGGVFDRIDSLIAVIAVYAAIQALFSVY
jgi:phosphatidate cytidylyltransferase